MELEYVYSMAGVCIASYLLIKRNSSNNNTTDKDKNATVVCIFASASSKTGLGHVVRCQSLARVLSAAGVTIRWCSRKGPDSEAMLRRGLGRELDYSKDLLLDDDTKSNSTETDLEIRCALLKKIAEWSHDAMWLIVDDYGVNDADIRAIRNLWETNSNTTQLMVLDDHQSRSSAHLRLAPMSESSESNKDDNQKKDCPTLTGLEHLLMRPEFAMDNTTSERNAWFICFGGADTEGLTKACIRRLIDSTSLQSKPDLIVCASDRMAETQELDALLEEWPGANAERKAWVGPAEMASLLKSSSGALVSCSGIATEALAMLTPIVGVSWVDNQKNHAARIQELGITVVDNALSAADALLQGKASNGTDTQKGVDPYGAWRVAATLLKSRRMLSERTFTNRRGKEAKAVLRRGTFHDGQMLLDWRNDPATRAGSLSTDVIPLPGHLKWYACTLVHPQRILYVLEIDGIGCGSGRLDVDAKHGEVELSWTIAPQARGRGLSYVIAAMLHEQVPSVYTAIAIIKSGNVASKKIARSLGFSFLEYESKNVEKWT